MTDRSARIEAKARQIALDHDLDPDDARLGYPAWRIAWILEKAAADVDAETLIQTKEG